MLAPHHAEDLQGGAGQPGRGVAAGTGCVPSQASQRVVTRGPTGGRGEGQAFGILRSRCGGQDEELGVEVGFFRRGGGDALLLPSSHSEVASDKVLKTERNRGAIPAGHPWGPPRRCSTVQSDVSDAGQEGKERGCFSASCVPAAGKTGDNCICWPRWR